MWVRGDYLNTICRHYEFTQLENRFGTTRWEREEKGRCLSFRLLSGAIVPCATAFAKALTQFPGLELAWKTEEEWAAELASFVEVVEALVSKTLTARLKRA